MQFPEIRTVGIESVKPYPNNAKKHPDRQIELLAKQIAEGFDQPIVVDSEMVIIKGHGRLLASKKLGLKTVPIIVRDDLSSEQVKAARIADNKLAETDWDMDLLAQELEALELMESDLEDLGFDEDELIKILDRDTSSYCEDGGDDVSPDELWGGDADDVPQSTVRMVQLFLDTQSHPLFIEITQELESVYGTDNATDTVMAGLKDLCEKYSIKLQAP